MPLPAPPDTSSQGRRTNCHIPANNMRGLPGTITRCAAPVESFTDSTFCHVLPPSAVRYTPRSGFGAHTWPRATTKTMSGLAGSITIWDTWPTSPRPMNCEVLPRGLHVARRRQDLAVHGPGRRGPGVPDRDRSRQSGHRLRGRSGPRVGAESGAWRVPYRGRWQDMAEGAVRERLDRCCAPGDGTGQPPHVVRWDVAVRAPTVGARVRRSGKRCLSLQGWRVDLGAPHAGPAVGRDGQHGRRRGPDQSEPRLRAHRDQRGDVVGLEGPGRPLDQGVGFPRALRPAVLLLADARVTGG